MELSPGSLVDNRFELIEEIGSGGMGSVFRAKQKGLDRDVAIKILAPLLVSDEESLKRFEREARSISLLHHLHIAAFYSYGIHAGKTPFIAMEFLQGTDLRTLICVSSEGLEWKRAILICIQICEAMSYAHAEGVVHRDLKPSNIILLDSPKPDWVKVLDFGLAKVLDQTESGKQRLTRTGELIGSVDYLSPEQCLGRQADERSDIYSLACILFEMLTGRPPFQSDNPIGQIHKHANEESPLISTISQKLFPPGLELLINKALSKNPSQRYQTMEEFRQDLQLIVDGKGGELVSALQDYGKKKRSKPSPIAIGLLGICFAIFLAIISGAFWYFKTDAGICYQVRSALQANKSDEARMLWLKKADDEESNGHAVLAELMRAEVMKDLSAKDQTEFTVASLYLALAKKYKSEDKLELASRNAWKAFIDVVRFQTSVERSVNPRAKRLTKIVEESSAIAKLRPSHFTKTDAKLLMQVCRPIMDIQGSYYLNMGDLLERVLADSKTTANTGSADVLFNRVLGLFYEPTLNSRKIEHSIKVSEQTCREAYGSGSPAPAQAPSYAAKLFSRNGYKELALKYLAQAERLEANCTDTLDNIVLYGCMRSDVETCLNLGLRKEALAKAERELSLSCARTEECLACAESHNLKANVYQHYGDWQKCAQERLRTLELYNGFDYGEHPNARADYKQAIDLAKLTRDNPATNEQMKTALSKELVKAESIAPRGE